LECNGNRPCARSSQIEPASIAGTRRWIASVWIVKESAAIDSETRATATTERKSTPIREKQTTPPTAAANQKRWLKCAGLRTYRTRSQ
jgi:hypothetical protein